MVQLYLYTRAKIPYGLKIGLPIYRCTRSVNENTDWWDRTTHTIRGRDCPRKTVVRRRKDHACLENGGSATAKHMDQDMETSPNTSRLQPDFVQKVLSAGVLGHTKLALAVARASLSREQGHRGATARTWWVDAIDRQNRVLSSITPGR